MFSVYYNEKTGMAMTLGHMLKQLGKHSQCIVLGINEVNQFGFYSSLLYNLTQQPENGKQRILHQIPC